MVLLCRQSPVSQASSNNYGSIGASGVNQPLQQQQPQGSTGDQSTVSQTSSTSGGSIGASGVNQPSQQQQQQQGSTGRQDGAVVGPANSFVLKTAGEQQPQVDSELHIWFVVGLA